MKGYMTSPGVETPHRRKKFDMFTDQIENTKKFS